MSKKTRRSEFVSFEQDSGETFKYNLATTSDKYIIKHVAKLKHHCVAITQKASLLAKKIDLKKLKSDLVIWLLEALIEGFIINFIVWALLDWKFNALTMIAWGFATKQALSMYWRMKKDGATPTISEENK